MPARRPDPWAALAAAVALTLLPSPSPAGAAPRAAEPTPPLAPDAARVVLDPGTASAPLDVEVLAFTGEVRAVARRRMEPREPLTFEVPLGRAPRSGIHVRAHAADAPFALPEAFSVSVPLVRGRTHTLTVAPAARPRPHPGATCGSTTPPPPPDADFVDRDVADIDGDGDREVAVVWSQVEGGVRRWFVGVQGPEPPGRHVVTAPLPRPAGFDSARPETSAGLAGVADVDADGTDELVLVTGRGGHTQDIQLWGLRGCALQPVVIDGRSGPATFPVGASATSRSGLSCFYLDGPKLTVWQAEGRRGHEVKVTTTEHRWLRPGVLGPGATTSWTRPDTDEWTLLEASGLRCGRTPFTLAGVGVATVPAMPALTG